MAAAEKQLLAMQDMEEMVEYLKIEVPSWPLQELQASPQRPSSPHTVAQQCCAYQKFCHASTSLNQVSPIHDHDFWPYIVP